MTCVSSRVPEPVVTRIDGISKPALAALTLFSRFLNLSRQWRQRASDRRHLSQVNDHVLADFGLTRQEAIDEAAKPFWRPLDPGSGRPAA